MTPRDQQIIFEFGSLTYNNGLSLIVSMASYGMFVLVTLFAVRAAIIKPWTRSRIVLLICLITIYVCMTYTVCYTSMISLFSTKYTLVKVIPGPQGFETEVGISDSKTLPLQYTPSWTTTINLLISDAIVVWRAWTLFQRAKIFKLLLLFLMFSNVVINIADCIWIDTEVKSEAFQSTVLDWMSNLISLVVNLLATGLISWTAWSHRRMLASAQVQKRSKVENLLLMLIESGAIYCGIQTIFVVVVLLDAYVSILVPLHLLITIALAAASCYPAAVVMILSADSSPLIETFHAEDTKVVSPSEGNDSIHG
ncbi:hypothetical protein D9757_010052 [Collybiopsis confluens]|uniref:Uncharacterized protein n=1 Tax=Collybiopsis confluens TaxID=2823264 RepID=A0A8H5LYH0_9AGAR|nr:hypothetical protein D9757_010052 [Collybiopsis confluens]